ncbi:MAG: choice-of-anchor X domain-containing protein [Candidatus Micrarchaeota archaeon]
MCAPGCVLNDTDCTSTCGNGKCDSWENRCNCPLDCGICSGSVINNTCAEYGCSGGACIPVYKTGCCGNKICEGSENYSCSGDCIPTCGNRICDPGEDKCSCPGDCGACSGACAGPCGSLACTVDGCVCVVKKSCCGNGACESGESYSNCPMDCLPKEITIAVLSPKAGENYMRGDEMLLKVSAAIEGAPALGASVSASGFFGKITLYDDGNHDDENASDGIYAASLVLGKNATDGTPAITFEAKRLTVKGTKAFNPSINASLSAVINAQAQTEKGDILEMSGTISRRGAALSGNITISASTGTNVKIFEITTDLEDGTFSYSYHTTLAEPAGVWRLSANFSDEFGNIGNPQLAINVIEPAATTLALALTPFARASYRRGEEISITVKITSRGAPVSGARAFLRTPKNIQMQLNEIENGTYTLYYTPPFDEPLGAWSVKVDALKSDENASYSGSASATLDIQPSQLALEFLEPTENEFQIGEQVQIKLKALYPSSEPASAENATVQIGDETLALLQIEKGIYTANYKPVREGETKITASISDSFGNSGSKSLSLRVAGKSPFYYFEKYRAYIIAVAIIVVLIVVFAYLSGSRMRKRSELLRRKAELLNLKAGAQDQYFNRGTLSRRAYDELVDKYDAELDRIEKELK